MKYIHLLFRLVVYFFVFIFELILSNIAIAKLILAPKLKFQAGAIKMKSKMKTNAELVLVTNSITMTPGTLVMDADVKTGEVRIHAISDKSIDEIKKGLQTFPEDKALWAIRGKEKA